MVDNLKLSLHSLCLVEYKSCLCCPLFRLSLSFLVVRSLFSYNPEPQLHYTKWRSFWKNWTSVSHKRFFLSTHFLVHGNRVYEFIADWYVWCFCGFESHLLIDFWSQTVVCWHVMSLEIFQSGGIANNERLPSAKTFKSNKYYRTCFKVCMVWRTSLVEAVYWSDDIDTSFTWQTVSWPRLWRWLSKLGQSIKNWLQERRMHAHILR